MESKESVAEAHRGHEGHHPEPEHGHEHHDHGHHHHEHEHGQVIHYTVDGEPQKTTKHTLTPRQILTAAGIDPTSYYLVQLSGHERESFKDRPDEPIHLHEHEKFVSVYMSSTPVS